VVISGVHYLRNASSNTADTITIAALPGGVTVAAGNTYQCKIPVHVTDIERIGGTTQTGRDWSTDFANLDIALSALRDAIQGASTKDLTTVEAAIAALQTAGETLQDVIDGIAGPAGTTATLNDVKTAVEAVTAAVGALQTAGETLADVVTAITTADGNNTSALSTVETAVDAVTTAITALSDGANVVSAVNAIATLIGEVQASPTANTVLARLKDLLTGIVLAAGTNIIGQVGIDQTTPGTTNAVEDTGYGSTYRNTATMADDNATRFETSATKLRYAKIKVTTNAMVFGDASTQDWNVAADETLELAKFDLSTLYFKNAGAGSNGTVNIIGVTE